MILPSIDENFIHLTHVQSKFKYLCVQESYKVLLYDSTLESINEIEIEIKDGTKFDFSNY